GSQVAQGTRNACFCELPGRKKSSPGHPGSSSPGGSLVAGCPSKPWFASQQLPNWVSVSTHPGCSSLQSLPSSSSHQKSVPFRSRVPSQTEKSTWSRSGGRVPMQLRRYWLFAEVSYVFSESCSPRSAAGTQCSVVPLRQLSKM